MINMEFTESEESEGSWSGSFGLRFKITPSFVNLIQSKLNDEAARKQNAQQMPTNFKASNFPASRLVIGSWRRISKNAGDLTAKFLYKAKRMVWEVLDGRLKSKIEIQWHDISAISAHTLDNGDGMLEILLNEPPSFSREKTPIPGKHTNWETTQDFTEGRASTCRRHTVYFPPGELEKHYVKLLHYNQHLSELSNKPFPSNEYPYFNQNPSRFSDLPLPTDITELPHAQHNYPVQNFPGPPIFPPHSNNLTQKIGPQVNIMDPLSPMSVMDPLYIDEGGRSSTYDNQWGNNQGVKVNNHIQSLQNSIPMTIAQGNSYQNYNLNYGEESPGMNTSKYPQLDLQQAESNTIHWMPPHQGSDEGTTVNSSMNTPMYQYVPQRQISNRDMDVNSAMNTSMHQYMPAHPVSNQGMSINSAVHMPLYQYAPPDQVSNRGMDVNSSMNTSMQQYAPPHQVFNRATDVNSAISTPMYQYAPLRQVSSRGIDVNSSTNASIYQYVPPQQVFSWATVVNAEIYTPMYQSALPRQVSKDGTNISSSLHSSAYQYTLPDQWGNQGVNNSGSNYAYENQWGSNGINNHNQGLDSIPIQGNDFQNYNLNDGEELSGINNENNSLDVIENLLQDDSQATCLDEIGFLPTEGMNVNSTINPLLETQQQAEGHTIQDHPQPKHWLPPQQVPNEGLNVNSTMNTSTNPYLSPEPTMEDFSDMAARQNTHKSHFGGYPNPTSSSDM